jgi:HEAT repeat protein
MSSQEDVVERLAALRSRADKNLLAPRTRELMQQASEALMSLSDDERFLADLLEQECEGLGGSGDLLVCAVLRGAIVQRKIRDAVPILNRMLADPRAEAMHEDLAETLGRMGDASSVPWLIDALSSKEVSIRAKAAESIGRLADPRAIPPLIKLLNDDSDNVRENAIQALAEMGAVQASDALLEVAASPEQSGYIRSEAIRALGRMRIREAVPLLRRLREQEEDEEIRQAAADTLAILDNSK